jgi:hypothetical protein
MARIQQGVRIQSNAWIWLLVVLVIWLFAI